MNLYYQDREGRRLLATLYINGDRFDSVGVRYKGFSSYSNQQKKKPLNIELNYLTNQRYNDVKTIKLSNGFRDPTFIREVLAYDIARKYMPASQANLANVYINNEHTGLYISAEPVDNILLRKYFHEDNGIFIKGDPALAKNVPRFLGKANFDYLGTDSTAYYDSYQLKSENGWKDLIQLCEMINDPSSDIDHILNVDRTLWLLAFHNLVVNLDSPVNTPRNFYLYKNQSGLFNFIPWDLNMSFGTYKNIVGSVTATSVENLQKLDPLLNINNMEVPLPGRLLNIPQYQKSYIAHMKTIMKENFSNGWYIQRGREIQEIIAGYVMADKNKFYSYEQFWENLYNTLGDSSLFTIGLADLMEERIRFLESHQLFNVVEPVINDVSIKGSGKPDSTFTINAKVLDASKVFLGFRYKYYEKFQKIEMYDDGLHNDEAGKDGVFGVQQDLPAGELHYYIYAENEQAVVFLPPRAEYEYYKTSTTAAVVINELMAANNLTVSDEAGEYDDWLELYNNSEQEINLRGYYLSDKPDNLTKWQLPDTTIRSGEHLIIWADEDSSQGPMHANFKISADGEELFLLDDNQVMIDRVTFGIQETDVSYGRYPDGKGTFIVMQPTFAANNLDTINNPNENTIFPESIILFQNYPNPFNDATKIRFYLNSEKKISLNIYDITGRLIRALISGSEMSAGFQQLTWDGRSDHNFQVSSGIYFARIDAKNSSAQIKMLIIR